MKWFQKQISSLTGKQIADALDTYGKQLENGEWDDGFTKVKRYVVAYNQNYYGPSLMVEVYIHDDARYSTLADRWFMVFAARKYEGTWRVGLYDKGAWCEKVMTLSRIIFTPPSPT